MSSIGAYKTITASVNDETKLAQNRKQCCFTSQERVSVRGSTTGAGGNRPAGALELESCESLIDRRVARVVLRASPTKKQTPPFSFSKNHKSIYNIIILNTK
jgi:hypothetical protein